MEKETRDQLFTMAEQDNLKSDTEEETCDQQFTIVEQDNLKSDKEEKDKNPKTDFEAVCNEIIQKSKRRKRRIRIVGIVIFLLLAILAVGVILYCKGYFPRHTIIGTWDYDTVTVYRFDKDGKGALELPSGTYEFTYSVNEDKLSIDFASDAAGDKTYTFSVKGDKLGLTAKENNTDTHYELTRVSEP